MAATKYEIDLSDEERDRLVGLVTKGVGSARSILRANILLASDKNRKECMSVTEIASAYHTSRTTVENVRRSYVNRGLEATLVRKQRTTPPRQRKLTGEVEVHIIALACSDPPEGYARWTVRLLAEKTVELGYVYSISAMSVSRILKKMNLNLI